MADDKIVMTVFLEPSTRTRFELPVRRSLPGRKGIDFGATKMSSIQKGETFEDTVTMIDRYGPDVIVLRQSVPGTQRRQLKLPRHP